MAVAAYGIVANLAIVGTSLFNGVSQGLQPLASRYAADKDKTKKIKIYRHSRNIGIVIALLLVAGAWIFDEQLVAIFNKESVEELARIATVGLKLYFLGFIVASINLVKSGYYSAIGRAGISSIISICRGVVAIVIFALVLSKIFGIIGVWISFPVAEIFTLIVAFVCESINKKREI
jgi:Na+-driven multidrug efflux pump